MPDSDRAPVAASRPLLGCGAELKSTFCLAEGDRAWVGHHIGDLKNFETLTSFREGVAHFERLFAVEPAVVAHDLHPDYLSTRYALERDGPRAGRASSTTTRTSRPASPSTARRGPAVGAIFDGSGSGPTAPSGGARSWSAAFAGTSASG